jgi:hypothetical protein
MPAEMFKGESTWRAGGADPMLTLRFKIGSLA